MRSIGRAGLLTLMDGLSRSDRVCTVQRNTYKGPVLGGHVQIKSPLDKFDGKCVCLNVASRCISAWSPKSYQG